MHRMFEITSRVIGKTIVPTLNVVKDAYIRANTLDLVPGIRGLHVYRSTWLTDDSYLYREVKEFIDRYCEPDAVEREERHGDKYIMGEIGEFMKYILRREYQPADFNPCPLLVELGLAKKRRCNATRKPKEEAAS
ncbi:hypothetical protein SEA_SAGEFIRE_71 [Mycobacterium phage Sagefire]|nr:hypothetical protein SEA_SAGEFIRE_71 [Mycobacterium phage Sagefire]